MLLSCSGVPKLPDPISWPCSGHTVALAKASYIMQWPTLAWPNDVGPNDVGPNDVAPDEPWQPEVFSRIIFLGSPNFANRGLNFAINR